MIFGMFSLAAGIFKMIVIVFNDEDWPNNQFIGSMLRHIDSREL